MTIQFYYDNKLNLNCQMTKLNAEMQKIYSTAKVCKKPNDQSGKCYPLDPGISNSRLAYLI